MTKIVLSTLNAKYIHTAFGLRYLMANMGELQDKTGIYEYDLKMRPLLIAESLLLQQPTIIGFGVYIWNVENTLKTIMLIKKIRPQVMIVIGGPEVSYEAEDQEITQLADYVIQGEGEIAFYQLCKNILNGQLPSNKMIAAQILDVNEINLPYHLYSEKDIQHRVIYVEASRGCPFKCEFCLSSLDKKVREFDLKQFLQVLEYLYSKGARQFKFVDRTFNLKIESCLGILTFFYQRLCPELFVHFEIIPDRLPDKLKSSIQQFPPGTLQFEVGVQTFNTQVQSLISRKQDNLKTAANIQWLRQHSNAHLHTDLIIGLPGESVESFAVGFDALISYQPHEIQVGLLKRLKGTPIQRHEKSYGMVFNPQPPFDLLYSDLIDFDTMQQLRRFSRYWDLIGNSGNFKKTCHYLFEQGSPFQRFLLLSEWIYQQTGQVHAIALKKLYGFVFEGMIATLKVMPEIIAEIVGADYHNSTLKGWPDFLQPYQLINKYQKKHKVSQIPARQFRHIN